MQKNHKILLGLFFLVLFWSAWNNADYFTWALEVAPGVLGVAVLAFTFGRFKFTNMVYVLILVHCVILFVGAKYTYAKVPLFDWLRDYFAMDRNNYDKLGHFAQGFIPAMISREVFIRFEAAKSRGWVNFFVVSFCLAVSALYELVEWWVGALSGEGADAFLGSQGYVWDTQSDMFCALLGACCALALLSRTHDRAMGKNWEQPGWNTLEMPQ